MKEEPPLSEGPKGHPPIFKGARKIQTCQGKVKVKFLLVSNPIQLTPKALSYSLRKEIVAFTSLWWIGMLLFNKSLILDDNLALVVPSGDRRALPSIHGLFLEVSIEKASPGSKNTSPEST